MRWIAGWSHCSMNAQSWRGRQGGPNGPPGDAPVLIRIDVKAGHGAGKPTSKLIDTATDTLAFLVEVLHVRTS